MPSRAQQLCRKCRISVKLYCSSHGFRRTEKDKSAKKRKTNITAPLISLFTCLLSNFRCVCRINALYILPLLEFQISSPLALRRDCAVIRSQFIGFYCRPCLTRDEMKVVRLPRNSWNSSFSVYFCVFQFFRWLHSWHVSNTLAVSVFTRQCLKRITFLRYITGLPFASSIAESLLGQFTRAGRAYLFSGLQRQPYKSILISWCSLRWRTTHIRNLIWFLNYFSWYYHADMYVARSYTFLVNSGGEENGDIKYILKSLSFARLFSSPNRNRMS